ncbi:MAG: hypothetical protein GY716_15445 [bacterium]|nr:hypothetical protein [bacterium]
MRTHRFPRLAFPIFLAAALLAAALPAAAHERGPYDLEVLVDGVPLQPIHARGKTYVEAVPGREYALRVTNRTSERIAVALTVDGLNTIDAETGPAAGASKWIVGPHRTVLIDGWQTDRSTARRFFFTTEDRSYGEWLGKTHDLGSISAVVFRERRPAPRPIAEPSSPRPLRKQRRESGRAPAGKAEAEAGMAQDRSSVPGEQPLSDDLAATGIGRQVEHRVQRVTFDAESSPASVINLRYEYHDALVRLGVRPRKLADIDERLQLREHGRLDDGSFAPDPYR